MQRISNVLCDFSFKGSERKEWCVILLHNLGGPAQGETKADQRYRFPTRNEGRASLAHQSEDLPFAVVFTEWSQRSEFPKPYFTLLHKIFITTTFFSYYEINYKYFSLSSFTWKVFDAILEIFLYSPTLSELDQMLRHILLESTFKNKIKGKVPVQNKMHFYSIHKCSPEPLSSLRSKREHSWYTFAPELHFTL